MWKLDGLLGCSIIIHVHAFLDAGRAISLPVEMHYLLHRQPPQTDRIPVGCTYQTKGRFCEEMIATLVSEET